jgi:2',3'-cyclic-nucleotide 2'-phosphodiesterase (5'-nucleotidase family)
MISSIRTMNASRWAAVVMAAILMATAMLVAVQATGAQARGPREPVTIQFLNVSDWHGQLDPLGPPLIGGAAVLSAYFQADRQNHPTLTLTAGDDFGASPPLSSFFNEEPAVLAQRLMGIQVGTFGNHNFDKGVAHLQNMIDLAGAPTLAGTPGAPYRYVSANLRHRDDELSGVEDFALFEVGGVSVGVVGITNPEAPSLVFPGNFGSIVPTNPYPAANRARAAATAAGADIVIAVTHMGLRGIDQQTGEPFGELVDFANNVGGFDVIFGDHTDIQFQGVINGQLVLENKSKGATYARTLLTVDPGNGRVLDRSVTFVTPTASAVTPDPAIETMLAPYRAILAPIMNRIIGYSDREILRSDSCGQSAGRTCESLLGNVVTDAMRDRYDADFAVTNSGGLRANLTCPGTSTSGFCRIYTPPPFQITRGRSFEVLPFGNFAMTLQVNGEELKQLLEFGVGAMPAVSGTFHQVSGLCFSYDISEARGSRVIESSVVRQAADGSCDATQPVDLTSASTYDIVENDFMVAGGEGHPVFLSRASSDGTTLEVVLAEYLMQSTFEDPIEPRIQGRIVCTTSGSTACPAITAP